MNDLDEIADTLETYMGWSIGSVMVDYRNNQVCLTASQATDLVTKIKQ